MYDFIVVGAGIAGLATAELLQRSGRSVLLIESAPKICSRASAQQQGWFHTGALYAALPRGTAFRKLVVNVDNLLKYYSSFPDMNLAFDGQLVTAKEDGWFTDDATYYLYVHPSDPSLSVFQRPFWRLAILCAQARLSRFETIDFTRELSPQIRGLNLSANLGRCLSDRRFDFVHGKVGAILKSRDRTVDAARMMGDLLNSFLSHGGELRTGTPVTSIERGRVQAGDQTFEASHTIVSAGSAIGELSKVPAKVVHCPLLVVKPALADVNFVRLTMNIDEAFNHIRHETPGGTYSLIGDNSYYDPQQPLDELEARGKLVSKVERFLSCRVQSENTSLYFGVKTELTSDARLGSHGFRVFRRLVSMPESYGAQPRNYGYHIIDTDDCVVALPGKMSLAFSLAVNVCRHFGIDPAVSLREFRDMGADEHVGESNHRRRFASIG